MRTINLVTLFDKNYAVRGLTLYRSLERTTSDFKLHILAIGHEAYESFYKMQDLGLMPNAKIYNVSMLADRKNLRHAYGRFGSPYFFFTMTPFFTMAVYDDLYPHTQVGYIDADCYFFGSARQAFDEAMLADVGVVPHRFPPHDYARLIPNGKYNVSLVTFGQSRSARDLLNAWKLNTLSKCDASTVGDQKYLDDWGTIPGLTMHEFSDPIGVAPWNLSKYKVEHDQDGKPTIDGKPIVFYHFHEFKPLEKGGFRFTGYPLREEDMSEIYRPYVNSYLAARNELSRFMENPL